MHNRLVKFGLKIPNRLGKMLENLRGGVDSTYITGALKASRRRRFQNLDCAAVKITAGLAESNGSLPRASSQSHQ